MFEENSRSFFFNFIDIFQCTYYYRKVILCMMMTMEVIQIMALGNLENLKPTHLKRLRLLQNQYHHLLYLLQKIQVSTLHYQHNENVLTYIHYFRPDNKLPSSHLWFYITDEKFVVRIVMPTVEEVCATFGLNDVKIQYNEADFQNLTNYKFFTQHVRPILAKENPKVCFDLPSYLIVKIIVLSCECDVSLCMYSIRKMNNC